MFYSIVGLYPRKDISIGRHGFFIKLFPEFKQAVAASDIDQHRVEILLDRMKVDWLHSCGFSGDYQRLDVKWGEWGPEHISVPGNACGLDLDSHFGAPRNGAILQPHNVDSSNQKLLLLIVFCWFAEAISLEWQIAATTAIPIAEAEGGE